MSTTVKRALKKPAAKVESKSVAAEIATKVEKKAGDGEIRLVRRKELVERIVMRSGLKPNAVKTVLDAVLLEMGNVLSAGEGLNVQPLGKLVVNRRKDIDGGEVLNCKLRRKTAPATTTGVTIGTTTGTPAATSTGSTVGSTAATN
ncbi:MAG: HU family DNA-binding protein [Halocynthiibacter sp.]